VRRGSLLYEGLSNQGVPKLSAELKGHKDEFLWREARLDEGLQGNRIQADIEVAQAREATLLALVAESDALAPAPASEEVNSCDLVEELGPPVIPDQAAQVRRWAGGNKVHGPRCC